MVGIAGMIGGAIFVLTGPAIGLAGSAVILARLLAYCPFASLRDTADGSNALYRMIISLL